MKVHLIRRETIELYARKNARISTSFNAWLTAVKYADWDTPSDILHTFGSADLLGDGSYRVVFDIGGNTCRMICKYAFGDKQVHLFICWIGNHAEYDELCSKHKQYTITNY